MNYSDEIIDDINNRTEKLKTLEDCLLQIIAFCNEYRTCENCIFEKKYKGCLFRGKTPREW